MSKCNAEQFEAEQEELNQKNNQFISSLPNSERAKFEAVSQAIDLLTKAGVRVKMYVELPSSGGSADKKYLNTSYWQFNNFNNFIPKDKFGNYTKASYAQMSIDAHKSITGMLTDLQATYIKDFSAGKSTELLYFLNDVRFAWYNYCVNGVLPKAIKDNLDENE